MSDTETLLIPEKNIGYTDTGISYTEILSVITGAMSETGMLKRISHKTLFRV